MESEDKMIQAYVSIKNKGEFYLVELVPGIYIEVNKMRKEAGQKQYWMAADPVTGSDIGQGLTRIDAILDARRNLKLAYWKRG